MAAEQIKKIAQNKKAYHDYFILETYEAGIELFGTEVKSIREGRINLKDSWCSIDGGEIFANSVHISPYDHGNIFNRDPLRVKRLLMHKKEIHRLYGTIKQQGLTLIPLSVYFKNGNPVRQSGAPLNGLVRVMESESGKFLGMGEIDDEGRVAPRRLVVEYPA